MNVAILLGAGASHGAGDVITPYPPPLGGDLYADLVRVYPGSWGSMGAALAQRFEQDGFELGMADAWAENSPATQQLLIDISRYFLEFAPTAGSNHYTQLLRVVHGAGALATTTFASLNYDCIFELAAMHTGMTVGYLPGSGSSITVLKPHGSCNLMIPAGIRIIGGSMSGVGSYYSGPAEAFTPEAARARYAEGNSMPSAMSLYAPGKPTPVAAQFVEAARTAWVEAVSGARVVVVIGARPFFIDGHIWDPVLEGKARLWFVGPSDAEAAELVNAAGDRVEHLAQSFGESIDVLDRRLTLLRGV